MKKKIGILVVVGLFVASISAQTTVTTSGGTTNTVPLFTGSSTLGNSAITQSNGNIGIGTTTPIDGLTVVSTGTGAATFTANISCVDIFRCGHSASFLSSQYSGGIGIGTGGNGVGFLQAFQSTTENGTLLLNPSGGTVGIGTSSPSTKLEVNGSVKLTSGSGGSMTFADGTVQSTAWTGAICGGDFAESVDVIGNRKHYEPGDVLVADPATPGSFLKSAKPYSTLVAGIYATKPGMVGHRFTDPKKLKNEIPMAMVGIVPTKVSAGNGPIQAGDLLVTSSMVGYAMKGTDRERLTGAVVGKALGNLNAGTGVIEVLVSLQ